MAQQSVGDGAARDALATYRKLDERINAQMLSAIRASESERAAATADLEADSRTARLGGGTGLPSHLETPQPAASRPETATPSGPPLPPASFRPGSKAWAQ